MIDAEAENENYLKPCRIDGETPCVQYPEEDECDCDPCEDCEIARIHREVENEN